MYSSMEFMDIYVYVYIDGVVQNCINSSALAMELLQSCAKSSISS